MSKKILALFMLSLVLVFVSACFAPKTTNELVKHK